jgi:hypothetical protein
MKHLEWTRWTGGLGESLELAKSSSYYENSTLDEEQNQHQIIHNYIYIYICTVPKRYQIGVLMFVPRNLD